MDIEKLIERLKNAAGGPEGVQMCIDAATAIETLRADLDRVTAERDAAVECIYNIEDDLDRGSDNDWARAHIAEWENQKED